MWFISQQLKTWTSAMGHSINQSMDLKYYIINSNQKVICLDKVFSSFFINLWMEEKLWQRGNIFFVLFCHFDFHTAVFFWKSFWGIHKSFRFQASNIKLKILYARHYKPRLVIFFTHLSLRLRLILLIYLFFLE